MQSKRRESSQARGACRNASSWDKDEPMQIGGKDKSDENSDNWSSGGGEVREGIAGSARGPQWDGERRQFNESRGSACAVRVTFVLPRSKTRECNHVVQCVIRELELFARRCFVDSDRFSRPRRDSRVPQSAAVDTRTTVNLEPTCQKRLVEDYLRFTITRLYM